MVVVVLVFYYLFVLALDKYAENIAVALTNWAEKDEK